MQLPVLPTSEVLETVMEACLTLCLLLGLLTGACHTLKPLLPSREAPTMSAPSTCATDLANVRSRRNEQLTAPLRVPSLWGPDLHVAVGFRGRTRAAAPCILQRMVGIEFFKRKTAGAPSPPISWEKVMQYNRSGSVDYLVVASGDALEGASGLDARIGVTPLARDRERLADIDRAIPAHGTRSWVAPKRLPVCAKVEERHGSTFTVSA